jgi:ABC-type Zn uptake system ZnuABC Zn-binding protein ZnuA
VTKPTIVLLLALLALLPGCGAGCGKGSRGSDRLAVSVSIFPIYDLARRVAGPDADVALVLPPERNEHAYAPTPKDAENAARARVGVMVGLGLDPWMETLMADAAPKARLIKVGDRVPTLTEKDDALATDPHVWLDPERARLVVRAIAEELGKADSAHAIAYRKRATELDASLAALDKEVEARTKALTTRGLVTFHGGFQYFAERYKLEILGVLEPVPGTPPSEAALGKARELLAAKKVPALFREPQLDAAPARALAEQAKVPLGVLDPLGGGSETDSYEKLIRYDVAQLEKHLRGP